MKAKEGFAAGARLLYFTGIEMRRSAHIKLLPLAAALLVVAVTGCNRNRIQVYQVDSTNALATPLPPATAPMPATMPDGLPAPDNSGLPRLKYTLPDGWKEKALTQMRVGSFDVSEDGKSVDVSVIPLGGMAGGDLANVNRWRGQVGQSPVDEAGLKKLAEPVPIAGETADLFDIGGTNPGSGEQERILGVILHRDDTAWFFKMSGDAALAEKEKPAFIAFLKSVEFEKSSAPSTPAAMDMSQLPAGHPAVPGMMPDTSAAANQPAWTVPADWKTGEVSEFVLAKFDLQGAGGATAAVTVSQLDGDGGGLLPNLNRWRGQVGLPAITADDAAKLPTIDASGLQATLADFAGTDASTGKPTRLVGAVLPRNGQTWFYKLMGDPAVVAQQKDAFVKFIQSAKYPAAQ